MGTSVTLGIERLRTDPGLAEMLRGRRIGFITNNASIDSGCRRSIDVLISLQDSAGFEVTTLFAPEHGLDSQSAATAPIDDQIDAITGLPVRSLYGENPAPTAAMLEDVDTLVFELQDVGVRFYTFVWTMYHAMQAASRHGKAFVVLDRPNPLGDRVCGPVLDRSLVSFVGAHDLPVQHGMTIGELALLFDSEVLEQPLAELHVVAMQGYRPAAYAAGYGLPWAPPSPNVPHLSTAWAHAATGILDGLDVSVGCGTPLPFFWVGSPEIGEPHTHALVRDLHSVELPGVTFRPAAGHPLIGPGAGRRCQGVQLHIGDPAAFDPLRTGLHLVARLVRETGIGWRTQTDLHAWSGTAATDGAPWFDRLIGDTATRSAIAAGTDPDDVLDSYRPGCTEFRHRREPYRLYSGNNAQSPLTTRRAQ